MAVGEQFLIDFAVSGELPQDKLLPRGLVPDQADGSSGAFFHQTDGLIFFLQDMKQPGVNDNPSKFAILCSQHIVTAYKKR